MDHKALIDSLGEAERRALTARSDLRGLVHLAGHLGAIGLTSLWIATGAPGWQAALVLQGILIIFLFTLLHEAIHRTPFASVWLNDLVARVCGFVLVLPADWFRWFHFAHHRHTQDPDRDPELAYPKPETWGQYMAHVSGLPTWRGEVATVIRNARGRCTDSFVPPSGRARVRVEARWMLAGYAGVALGSLATGSALALWLWVLPMLLGQPFLRLYLMAEHGRCGFVANMLANSRTTLTNRLVRALAWNMPYHAEHHAWPAVPFHQLPALHARARAHLAVLAPGYRHFHAETIRTLR